MAAHPIRTQVQYLPRCDASAPARGGSFVQLADYQQRVLRW
jgi:hypothetical protein